MKKLIKSISLAAVLLLSLATFSVSAAKFVTIGTAGVTGVYYPAGGAIAKMINQKRDEYGIRATVESTGGSVFNVNALTVGDLEFGVVQSDTAYQAVMGQGDWESKGKQDKLRSVFSLHPELVNLIVASDEKITDCKSLKGKRIAVGNIGSGTRENAKDALSTCGLEFSDIIAEDLKASEAAAMLGDGRIAGYFYTVGHPNGSIKEAAAGVRSVRFLGFEAFEQLLKDKPYYVSQRVPTELYTGVSNSSSEVLNTFAVKALFLTSADVPVDVVYAATKEVFENFDEFKSLHPAFAVLTKEEMLQGLSAPLHPGAEKYYRETGLIK